MGYEQIKQKQNTAASRRDFSKSVPKQRSTIQPSPLQHYRDIGNQAVQRMMETRAIQAKLTIGQPNDIYEQEADRAAGQVMRMPEPVIRRKSSCPECEEEEELIQTKGDGNSHPEVTSDMESHIESLKGGGQPLSESSRSFFEPRFSADFSQVRIHTNAKAAQSAKAMNALAFTVGRNVVFAGGQYSGVNMNSRKLLAHELAHVVQNRDSDPGPIIKRFEGYEHQDIGDEYLDELLTFLETDEGEQWANDIGMSRDQLINDIRSDISNIRSTIRLRYIQEPGTPGNEIMELTAGQIISLIGDHYGSLNALINAPAKEISEILKLMKEERYDNITSPEATKEYEKISGGQFLELAERNEAHFFRKNKQVWRQMHEEAIAKAKEAGENNNREQFQEALLIDTAAAHFLTDAFTSGHLFDKNEVLVEANLYLINNPPRASNPSMQTYLGIIGMSGKMPQLVVRLIHDKMNIQGFQVKNDREMEWHTYGDRRLKDSPETKKVAALAVFLSRQQIVQAKNGEDPNPNDVETLLPNDDTGRNATRKAIKYIPEVMKELEGLIYQNRELSSTQFGPILGTIIKSNLSAMGSPGWEERFSREHDAAIMRGDPLPVLMPNFTIFEWDWPFMGR